jgi:hypothetical protein
LHQRAQSGLVEQLFQPDELSLSRDLLKILLLGKGREALLSDEKFGLAARKDGGPEPALESEAYHVRT